MLPGMTDHSKLGVDEQSLTALLEMAYRKQVAMRRVAYVPNNLTSGAIKKLAHILTDRSDNRFMIVLDGSTATGKTTLNADGDPIKSAVIKTVKDGKFTYIDMVNPGDLKAK